MSFLLIAVTSISFVATVVVIAALMLSAQFSQNEVEQFETIPIKHEK
jgi:hypothetical protein